MAQYHKIPQNVTQYEGRIIGKFTAKQFIFLAIGAIAAFAIGNSPLSQKIKIVLIVIIVLVSLALSLASVDGRTSDKWLTMFISVVYKPTQRMWRKTARPPAYLLPSYHPPRQKRGPRKRSVHELNELINIWQPEDKKTISLSTDEKTALQRIRNLQQEIEKHDPKKTPPPNEVVQTPVNPNNNEQS